MNAGSGDGVDPARALADRLARLESASRPDGELDPWGPNASTAPGTGHRLDTGEHRLDRAALLKRVATEIEDTNPRAGHGRLALVVAGPPAIGAGALAHRLLTQAGRRSERFVWLDPADVTDRLLQAHLDLEGPVAPPCADGFRPTARECAGLLHNEAAALTGQLLSTAVGRRQNVVLRSTLGDIAAGHELLGLLQDHDYRVHLVATEAARAEVVDAVHVRWARGHRAYQQGLATGAGRLGGRFVPTTAVERLYDEHGRGLPALAARELAETELVSSFRRYRVSGLIRDVPSAELLEVHEGGTRPVAPALHEAMRLADLGTGLRPGLARRRPGRSRPALPPTGPTHPSRRETGQEGPEL